MADLVSAFVAVPLLATLVWGTYIGLTRGNPTAVCAVAAQTVWIALVLYGLQDPLTVWLGAGVMVAALVAWNVYDWRRFRRDLREVSPRHDDLVWSFVDEHHDRITAMEAERKLTAPQADTYRRLINAYATDLLRAFR